MLKIKEENSRKSWPLDCPWPEPYFSGWGFPWEPEDADTMELDKEGRDMLAIVEYYDHLVECGRLNDDYTWNYEYDGTEYVADEPEDFFPELGEDYWTDTFEYSMWEEDLCNHINLLKIDPEGFDTLIDIEAITGYHFINENLLRQAFTRRSFATEYGLNGCCEQLEFLGDSVLDHVVTREITHYLTELDASHTDAPFSTTYTEGDLTRIRTGFVSGEYLAAKASELGLDKYILYGSDEEPTDGSREDVIEALIGAVTIDCGWDWDVIEELADRLLCIQLNDPDKYLKKTYYEIFNSWHQRNFGEMPDYEISGMGPYWCLIRFNVPENDKDIWRSQILDAQGRTRSKAREMAAELAYRFVAGHGLLFNVKNAGIVPNFEDSINQLQELYQKKYLEEPPVYTFEEEPGDIWFCTCSADGTVGWGKAGSKTQAKKQAALKVLEKLMCVD